MSIITEMLEYVQVARVKGRLPATKTKVKTVKVISTCLFLYTVYCF